MPIILKEPKLLENLDESSRKSLKNLSDSIFNNDANVNEGLSLGGPSEAMSMGGLGSAPTMGLF